MLSACSSNDDQPNPTPDPIPGGELYFPPVNGSQWETMSLKSLGWDSTKVGDLYSFLDDGQTRAFLVLKDGKIVLEHYNGKDLLALTDFDKTKVWYWASAGKTLTSFLVGQAQEDGHLYIDDPASKYMGDWADVTTEQLDKITVRHQLTMTSGLDDSGDGFCTDRDCLKFKAEPGTRWAYHNAPYTLLDSVVQNATKQSFDDYFNSKLRDPIGMDGFWRYSGYNHVYYSTARAMARFGILILNKGVWDNTTILGDEQYYKQMINTSQDINHSYGYLWWLNGKQSHMLPGFQFKIQKPIAPNAPGEMIAGMGKNGQLLNIIPSQNLIVIRMGDNPDISLVPAKFQDEMWAKLNAVMK